MIFKLKKPVELIKGEVISELDLREEMTAADFKGIKATALTDPTPEDLGKIVARLSGKPEGAAIVLALSSADYIKLLGDVVGFLGRGLELGSTTQLVP